MQIKERSSSLEKLIEEKKKTERMGVDIQKKIMDDQKNLEKFFNTRKKKIESINKSRDSIESAKEKIAEDEKKLKGLREDLEKVIKELVDAIEKRKAELTGSENERVEVRVRINDGIGAIDSSIKRSIKDLASGNIEGALATLKAINTKELLGNINKFEGYEDGFRSILFDKTGIHAKKEGLDKKIQDKMDSIEKHRSNILSFENLIQDDQSELENVNDMITRVEKDLVKNENERDWIEKHVVSLDSQIIDFRKQIDNYKVDAARSEMIIKGLKDEINEWEERLIEFNERSESLLKKIAELTGQRDQVENKIHDRKNVAKKDEDVLNRVSEKISSLDRSQVEIMFKKDNIKDHLWVEYEKKVTNINKLNINESEYNSIANELQEVKREIQELGPINNLAIEEYRDLKKRFDYYIKQKKDIEKAREDIYSVIADINKTSVDMFLSTFKEIQKNFSEIFKQLFEGGEATVDIIDLDNILESGIDIMMRPPGKKLKNISLLSGGERALTAIALLFATYMVKPSPFCFLDEIDAPLDEENIGRFVKLLKEFSRGSQFIIVTHNKRTMSICESMYGVTMEEPGVSKVVSLKMETVDSLH